jgi:hypothetical protein
MAAVSCRATSVVNSGGLTGGFDPSALAEAVFESDVTITGAGSFGEEGLIRFGHGGHVLRFTTRVAGWIAPSPVPETQQGTITWTVSGGEGQFSGAAGVITSNFTLDAEGEINDYQLGVLYLK